MLLAEARLIARVVEGPLGRGATSDELDPLVDAAARDVRARGHGGGAGRPRPRRLLLSGPDLARVENHGARPEVREAMVSGVGYATRRSATVGEDLLYVAVPVRDGPHHRRGAGGVALDRRDGARAALRRAVLLALALAFLITASLSALFARPLAGPLAEIMTAARQFAAGNLTARIRVQRSDELGELARILNQSATQLQERLTENARDRARSEAILSAMEDGVLGVDHKGVVLLANQALRKPLGLQDPVGHHYLEVIRQTEVGLVLERVLKDRRAQRGGGGAPAPAPRLPDHRACPSPATEGTPPGAVLTFHDATERQRLERVRRDFVANASHELRTPLTSIRGFVEALEDGAVSEPATAQRFLGKIRTHADRMAALVDDLLELSRLESRRAAARSSRRSCLGSGGGRAGLVRRAGPDPRHPPRRGDDGRPSWSPTRIACGASSRTWWRTR